MHRVTLERQQVWIYLGAIGLGLIAGHAWPALTPGLEALLWPTLMLFLHATFVQVPLLHLREVFGDRRFVAAVLIGNFVLLPLVAWVLVLWLPADPVLIVGVLGMVFFLWWVPRHLFPLAAPRQINAAD